jgi:hypothetical protein
MLRSLEWEARWHRKGAPEGMQDGLDMHRVAALGSSLCGAQPNQASHCACPLRSTR